MHCNLTPPVIAPVVVRLNDEALAKCEIHQPVCFRLCVFNVDTLLDFVLRPFHLERL